MSKKPRQRSGRKLLISTGFGLLLIAGVASWRSYINAEPQFAIPPLAKLPKPNGYDMYVRAATTIVAANPAVDSVNDPNQPTDPKVRAQKYSLQNKNAWLRLNAPAFATFQKALALPCRHASMRADDDLSGSYAKLRELARCKSIERRAREMSSDWNGAVQSQVDTVQMGTDVGRGGVIVSGLVAIAIGAIGRDHPWANVEKLNAVQARAAAARLENVYKRRLTYADVLQEDKWYGLSLLQKGMRDPSWRNVENFVNEPTLLERLRVFTVSKRAIASNVARAYDIQIANARLPYLSKKVSLPASDPVTEAMSPAFGKAHAAFARNDAGNALWLAALALRAYKLENESYPPQLRVLVPGYLKQVPADPFGGGEELRYRRTGSTYVLWSIGPDGINNGGKPIPFRPGRAPQPSDPPRLPVVDFDSQGDYVAGKNR